MGSVGNLWGFLNGCNFCGIETNWTNSEFVFFITFIFSRIIIAKYLYSQVIPLCAKRRPKTVIHIVVTKKGNQEQTMLKYTDKIPKLT